VGGNAQIKSMKKVAGTLKLDQAQFRELEAFAKFGSDLDAATQRTIDRGRKNLEILKQPQYAPETVEDQIAIIYASTKGFTDSVDVDKMKDFELAYLKEMQLQHADVLTELREGKLTDEGQATMKKLALEVAAQL
jgi:F-type H+-transporting ATPase subunit alpha